MAAAMWFDLIRAATVMSAIVALRYLAVSGAFAWITARLRPTLARPADPRKAARRARQIRREIGWSLLSAAIYGAPAGLVAYAWLHYGWTRIYTDVHAYPLWWVPGSVLLYLAAQDTWFYWTHRAMHARPRLFRAMHAVHHDSRPPTAWAAMSFHPLEALSAAWLVPALVFVVPIHVGALGLVMGLATLFAVTNHMGWEVFPRRWLGGWFGRHIITAAHHHRHHADYSGNYALYFRAWDRLCGTDRGLAADLLDDVPPKQVATVGELARR